MTSESAWFFSESPIVLGVGGGDLRFGEGETMPSHFKRLVRERMAKTGESWVHAQRHVRARSEAIDSGSSPRPDRAAAPLHTLSAVPLARGATPEAHVAPAQSPQDGERPLSRARADIEELEIRLVQLGDAIQRAVDAPAVTETTLSQLIDIVRWTRFYVNLSLAFRRQIHPLRDEAWISARYTDEATARNLLITFREASKGLTASRLDLVELRNLSARVDGLARVLDGWQRASR